MNNYDERAKQTIYDYYFLHLNRKKEDINIIEIYKYKVALTDKYIWLFYVTDGFKREYCEVKFNSVINEFELNRYVGVK